MVTLDAELHSGRRLLRALEREARCVASAPEVGRRSAGGGRSSSPWTLVATNSAMGQVAPATGVWLDGGRRSAGGGPGCRGTGLATADRLAASVDAPTRSRMVPEQRPGSSLRSDLAAAHCLEGAMDQAAMAGLGQPERRPGGPICRHTLAVSAPSIPLPGMAAASLARQYSGRRCARAFARIRYPAGSTAWPLMAVSVPAQSGPRLGSGRRSARPAERGDLYSRHAPTEALDAQR